MPKAKPNPPTIKNKERRSLTGRPYESIPPEIAEAAMRLRKKGDDKAAERVFGAMIGTGYYKRPGSSQYGERMAEGTKRRFFSKRKKK